MKSFLNRITPTCCLEAMRNMDAASVDLIFADPPFNIGYSYDVYADKLARGEYLKWSESWMREASNVLKADGTFWLAIGDEYAAELKVIAQDIGFVPRSWVIWYYTFGVNCASNFSRSHTHLLYFVKNPKQFTFRADDPANRIPSARQLIYKDKRANSKGRLPDNTWILRPQELVLEDIPEHDVWYFPRVCGTYKERQGFHGCQMPEAILQRIINSCSRPGEIVLDPFSGSGTTLAVAKQLGRHYIGFDISEQYVTLSRERLDKVMPGASGQYQNEGALIVANAPAV